MSEVRALPRSCEDSGLGGESGFFDVMVNRVGVGQWRHKGQMRIIALRGGTRKIYNNRFKSWVFPYNGELYKISWAQSMGSKSAGSPKGELAIGTCFDR
jgi:hypothetical protein